MKNSFGQALSRTRAAQKKITSLLSKPIGSDF